MPSGWEADLSLVAAVVVPLPRLQSSVMAKPDSMRRQMREVLLATQDWLFVPAAGLLEV